VTIQKF